MAQAQVAKEKEDKKRKSYEVSSAGLADFESRSTKRQKYITDTLGKAMLICVPADADNSGGMEGSLYEKLKSEKKLEHFTNFTDVQLRDLWLSVSQQITATKKRGPPTRITYLDSLILLLMLYKSGDDMTHLAGSLSFPYTTLRDAVVRIRPMLNKALQQRWWAVRRRPVRTVNQFSHIALLVDSNSQHIHRPKGSFDEGRQVFDAKNYIYAWKKEVAVMAQAPYYALFVSPKFAGSIHDYEIHKQNYKIYSAYLLKTPEERQQTSREDNNSRWALLGDSAYTGPASDTPEVRRVHIERYSQAVDPDNNKAMCKVRVPVEQFFGRMERAWYMTASIYNFDHQHFDTDYDNCVLLTNELIRYRDLNEQDYDFHWAIYTKRKEVHEQMLLKQVEAYKKWSGKRKSMLEMFAEQQEPVRYEEVLYQNHSQRVPRSDSQNNTNFVARPVQQNIRQYINNN